MQTLTNCSILIITLLLAVYIGQLHVVKVWHTWGTLNLIHVLYVDELYVNCMSYTGGSGIFSSL